MESKELASATAVLCANLQKTQETSPGKYANAEGKGITQVAVEAIVQSLRDGSTRVLCRSLNNDGTCKEKDNPRCHFVAPKIEE